MDVNPTIIRWICDFLTSRPQRVIVSGAISEEVVLNTGAPQGCVLSPALFTIYTADCLSNSTDTIQAKFSDDTSLTGLITSDESSYRCAVENLVRWCDENHLLLNVAKTKEMVVDFRRNPPPHSPLLIKGVEVEIVHNYKYLGSLLDDRLDWTDNITSILKRANQRLYFLKRLKSFDIRPELLGMFYRATVESVVTFNSLCFFGSLKEHDKARLTKITKTATRLIGHPVTSFQSLYEAKAVKRLGAILEDPTHPLCKELSTLTSVRSGRLRSMRARTNRFCSSFVPTAVRLTKAM
jgi:hypothetical protein